MATVSLDSSVQIWDAASGRLLASAAPGTRRYAYLRIAFSPDSRYVAATFDGYQVRVIDARDCRVLHTLRSPSTIYGLAFSPDVRRLATADANGAIHIWNVASGQSEVAWNETNLVFAAAFSPDGGTLVTATQNGVVRVWDVASGTAIATLTGPDGDVEALSFSPDGRWILAGSDSGEVWIWDAPTYGGTVLSRSAGAMAVSRDGRYVAVSDRQQVFILDAASSRRVGQARLADVSDLAFSPAGDRLACAANDGVRVIAAPAGSAVRALAGHTSWISAVAFSPDARYVASGAFDNTARIWDAHTGSQLAMMKLAAPVFAIAFSPEGQFLATASNDPRDQPVFDGAVRLFEVPSGRLVRTYLPPPRVGEFARTLAFHPRGGQLASSIAGDIRIAETTTGRVMAKLGSSMNGTIFSLAYSPDGSLLAAGGNGDAIRLWSTTGNELVFTLRRASENVAGLAFSADGTRLYARYWTGPLRVWSTATAYPADLRERVTQLQHEHPVTADVWRLLQHDATLEPAGRAAALQLCSWRADWYQALREHLWGPAVYPPRSTAEEKLLLQRAQDYAAALPWSLETRMLLGAAQYRNGLYQEAAQTLARAAAPPATICAPMRF